MTGCRPSAIEVVATHRSKGSPGWIVIHDRPRRGPDDDDVVERAGSILDQREDRAAVSQLARNGLARAVDRGRVPPSSANVVDERGCTDPRGTAVHEVRERFGVEASRTPVPHDHRGGGAAAQRLGLRNKWNVEKGQRPARLRAFRLAEQKKSGQQHTCCQPLPSNHCDRCQSMAMISRISTSRPMMITVVEMVTFDCPPASA